EADPDVALSGCTVALVDTAGNRHGATDSGLDVDAPRLASCVPESTPGPRATYGSTAPPVVPDGEDPRPSRYRTDTVFVLPDEAVPAAVRLWYALPSYVELPVDVSAG